MKKIRFSLYALLLLTFVSGIASAQTRRISGRVTTEGGSPLGSASVSVVGTALGGYTSEDGRFTIPAPDGAVTLRIRRIGYQQKTIPVDAASNEIAVTLAQDVLQLEQQVITG